MSKCPNISNAALTNAAYPRGYPFWDDSIGQPSKDLWNAQKVVIASDNFRAVRNQTYSNLVERIFGTTWHAISTTNRFEKLATDSQELGGYLQEIGFVEMPTEFIYKGVHATDAERIGGQYDQFKPNIVQPKACYHGINRQSEYKITMPDRFTKRAFLTEGALSASVANTLDLLARRNETDTEAYWKRTITDFCVQQDYPLLQSQVVEVPDITQPGASVDDIRAFLEMVAFLASDMSQNNAIYNAMARPNVSRPNDIMMMLDQRAFIKNQFQNWATTFHPEFNQWAFGNPLLLNNFGTPNDMPTDAVAAQIIGVIADKRTFSKTNMENSMEPARDAVGRFTNEILLVIEMYRATPFFNAVYLVRNKKAFIAACQAAFAAGSQAGQNVLLSNEQDTLDKLMDGAQS